MDTCTYHSRRKAIASLITPVFLCKHCLSKAMPWIDTIRNTKATPYTIAIYLDECAAYTRTHPR